ncbi:MAG: MFS transporter [Proteobacteria bacterium]|nr:MFS transporter [Pseudomonadota bacterium]
MTSAAITAERAAPVEQPATLPGAQRAAALLMLAYMLSFMDRQILVLMIEPLQRDLKINDSQFSLLHGTSFALFYTIVGLYVGGLIDRHHSVRILDWAVAWWSLATAVCGLARGYGQLFAARMMVGVGEAALSPGAYSLLSDYYEPRRRTRAFAIYATGMHLGSGVAFILGGRLIGYLESIPPVTMPLLGTLESWRLTFLVVGVPGLLLGLVIRWFIREPERGTMDRAVPGAEAQAAKATSHREFFAFVRANRAAYTNHNLGFGLHMMFSYAITSWLPVLLLRTYHWPVTQVGLVMGIQFLIFGPLGAFLGGKAARMLRERGDASAEMTLGAASCAMLLLGVVILTLFHGAGVVLAVAALQIFFVAFPGSLNAASLQIVAPPRFRGLSGALFMLVGNLLGLALGPLVVGMLTDYVFADKKMVGMSLLTMGVVVMPVAIALLLAGRRYFRMAPAGQAAAQVQPA